MYETLGESRRRFISIFLLLLFGIVALFGAWRYYQSSIYAAEGAQLLQQGKPEEAIIAYLKAQDLFPFRPDVLEDLKGARLILESDMQYGNIYQIAAQIQEVPPIPALPPPILKPGQLRVPILMYHHIRTNPRPNDPVWAALNVTPQQLDNQLRWLVDHDYHAITLDDLNDALEGRVVLPPNPIIVTFDDGYRNFYDAAFPIIKKYQMKVVSFVITDVAKAAAYLSWDQISELDRSGLVQFAAHSRHHADLTVLSPKLLADEVRGSKTDLESHLKKPILWFAYPYGSYNNRVIAAVRDAGFIGATSTIYGSIQSKESLYLMPRIMVDGRYSLDNFAKRISY